MPVDGVGLRESQTPPGMASRPVARVRAGRRWPGVRRPCWNEGWGYEVTGIDVIDAYELALVAAERAHIDDVLDQIRALLDQPKGAGNAFVRQFLARRL